MEKEIFDLFDLQQKLKKGIECLFPKHIWVRAEVSAVKARYGGHCYLELSQSDENGLVAKISAVIWSSKYRFIAPYFESVTGSPISEGMVVLVEVQVNYSELYGLSLVINDIDPEYSLGAKELERQKTMERLRSEGLMDLQEGLEMPALPYRLAVISAEDAAGYRDFMRHLHENPYGFGFETVLFPAIRANAKDHIFDERWGATMNAALKYAKDIYISGDSVDIIELPHTPTGNKEAMLEELRGETEG